MPRYILSGLILLSVVLVPYQAAESQSFVTRKRAEPKEEEPFIDTTPSSLSKSFDDFNSSLDQTATKMRKEYNESVASAEKKRVLEERANIVNNVSSGCEFSNGQAQAVDSGGLYNAGGNWGDYPIVGSIAAQRIRGQNIARQIGASNQPVRAAARHH